MKFKCFSFLLIALASCVFNSSAQDHEIRGTAMSVPGGIYREGKDGKYYLDTNKVDLAALWPGVWKEDTSGLREQLQLVTGRSGPTYLRFGVGSVKFNSHSYVGEPKGTFPKFELKDSNGAVVPVVRGKTLEDQSLARIRDKDLPRYNGGILHNIGFFTNGGPFSVNDIKLDDFYRITTEGDYTLNVCPVIYKWETNLEYLDRVNLPCITTTIHLKPSLIEK